MRGTKDERDTIFEDAGAKASPDLKQSLEAFLLEKLSHRPRRGAP